MKYPVKRLVGTSSDGKHVGQHCQLSGVAAGGLDSEEMRPYVAYQPFGYNSLIIEIDWSPRVMDETRNVIEFGQYKVPVTSMGSGRPLVFLHGFDGPQEGPFMNALAEGRRVIAPTHPGFAGSPSHPDIHSIHNTVIFYLDLFDELGLPTFDLAGHSLGGMFAAEIAALIPERARHLVLVSPFAFWSDEAPLPDVLATGGSALSRLLWADPEAEAAAAYQPAPFDRTCNWAAATNYLWPLPDRGLASRMHRIKTPTLLARGSDDRVVGNEYLQACAQLLPAATVAEIAGAGHFSMLERPDRFSQAVAAFLDS